MSRVPTTFTAGPVRVRVPATSANLGPGFDALGLALGLLRRRGRRGHPGRRPGDGDRARAPASCPTTTGTWSCGPCGPPSTCSGAQPAGLARGVRQPDPAGAWAGLVVGGDRRRACCWPARWSPTGRERLDDAGGAAAGRRDRGAPGQRGALPARRLHHRLDRADRGARGVAGRRRRRAAHRLRAGGARTDRGGAGRAAGHRAARRRRVQRRPGGAAGARADRATRRCCSRRPTTGCTRTTAPRGCRRRPPWSARCVGRVWRLWSVGRARRVLALTEPPDGLRPRERTGRSGGCR